MRSASQSRPLCVAPRWLAFTLLLAGGFLPPVDFFIVHVSLPSIRERLGATSGEIEPVVSACASGYAVLPITGGRLGDLYGRRRLFRLGVALFTLANAACGLAAGPVALVLGRVVLALSAAGLVSVALAALVIPLSEGRGLGWPGWVFGVLAAGPALIVWFLWHEDRLAARGGMPLLDLSLFRIESVRRGVVIATLFCFTACFHRLFFYLLFRRYEQEGRGRDPLQTAWAIVPYGIALFFGPLAGALLQRFHARLPALGMLVQVTGSAALAATVALGPAGWPATLAVFVAGFGQGVAFPRLYTMARGDVPPHQAGLANGIINAGLQVGGAVSVAAIGTLFFASFALLGRGADERACAHAFSVALAALTRALFVAMLPAVPRRRKGAALDGATAT